MKKKFTLYWPGFASVELYKDLGIITKIFNNHLDYKSCILCGKFDQDYNEVIKENIELQYIVDDNTVSNTLMNTDILMLIGLYDFNLRIIEQFKSINPSGKIYLKLDMNIHWLNRIALDKSTINLLKECTLISVECKNLKKIIDQKLAIKS